MTYSRSRITARTFQIRTGFRKLGSKRTASISLEVDKEGNMSDHGCGCKPEWRQTGGLSRKGGLRREGGGTLCWS